MVESIQTGLLELRGIRENDRAEYVRLREISQEHLRPWKPTPPEGATFDDGFDLLLQMAEEGMANGTAIKRTAALPDGRLAGFFTLSQIFRRSLQSAYAGWWVSADQIGRGIATTGVLALLDLAFAPEPAGLGLHRVQASIIPSNAASIRVAEKAGFRLEGRAKEYLNINGAWQDHLMFAKLATEHEPVFLRDD